MGKSGNGLDNVSDPPRLVVHPALKDARQLGRRAHEVGQLVEDQRSPPPRGGGFPGEPRQQPTPVPEHKIGEAVEAARDLDGRHR